MRLRKAWVIVRKEFSEYRKNRYILYSLFLMPVIMAVVVPIAYLLPVTASFGGAPQTQPYDLNLHLTNTFSSKTFDNTTILDANLVDCTLNSCVVQSSALSNCSVTTSLVQNSEFNSSFSIASAIWHSNIRNSTIDAASDTAGSIFVGQESTEVLVITLLVNSVLMFFVIIPAIIPTVIASYSFVGEKMNRSLEPLLATPTTDTELLAGKTLAIFLPSMLVTWIALIPTVVIVDVITQPVLGFYLLPNALWTIGVFVVAPLICILSVLFNVIVSARVTDVRTSQQIGSIVILPVIAFFVVGLAGVLTFDLANMALFAVALAAIDVGVIYLALNTFQRERILVRWK
ncbi:MAG TPA: ABC transporter permease subunit [Methanomassiliicoccales archaeon]|nr:ABC transporter permease subunit [Methanomassiliicoccales archaeon]